MAGARTTRAPRRDTHTAVSESHQSKAQNKSRLLERGPLAGDQKHADPIERVVQDDAPKDEPPETGPVSSDRRSFSFLRRAHGDSRSIELTRWQHSAESEALLRFDRRILGGCGRIEETALNSVLVLRSRGSPPVPADDPSPSERRRIV